MSEYNSIPQNPPPSQYVPPSTQGQYIPLHPVSPILMPNKLLQILIFNLLHMHNKHMAYLLLIQAMDQGLLLVEFNMYIVLIQ